tara:strand:- start:434 stop:568 length:135 start_codon:yes stop_codon:yes gene_type:complete
MKYITDMLGFAMNFMKLLIEIKKKLRKINGKKIKSTLTFPRLFP